jgi:hypothetical protein
LGAKDMVRRLPVKSRAIALISVVVAGAALVHAGGPKASHQAELKSRMKGAERAFVGRVTRMSPYMKRTDRGDVLIVSHVEMAVEEALKGQESGTAQMEIEGGTLNGVTMEVSDMPQMRPGLRAVVMLKQNMRGEMVPHQRGAGVLELEQEHVKNSDLWLDDVRLAAAEARYR